MRTIKLASGDRLYAAWKEESTYHLGGTHLYMEKLGSRWHITYRDDDGRKSMKFVYQKTSYRTLELAAEEAKRIANDIRAVEYLFGALGGLRPEWLIRARKIWGTWMEENDKLYQLYKSLYLSFVKRAGGYLELIGDIEVVADAEKRLATLKGEGK